MKYEITKEQLQELAKGNAKVERWFPEAFETKLEVGKWYKYKKAVFFIQSYNKGSDNYNVYGSNKNGDWMVENANTFYDSKFKPATESEVFEALKKEAVKRGFVEGVYIKSDWIWDGKKSLNPISSQESIVWDGKDLDCQVKSGSMFTLFREGKWAEIIKEKTLSRSQAEAKLNELINDGYTYNIN